MTTPETEQQLNLQFVLSSGTRTDLDGTKQEVKYCQDWNEFCILPQYFVLEYLIILIM